MSQPEDVSVVKRALLEIRELRQQLDAAEAQRSEPIAIVGMGLRFPGDVHSPDDFWDLLRNGRNAIGPIPPERWDINAYYDSDYQTPGKMYTRGGGFVRGVDQFDAAFFGISPREAASMDPQQRLLLEVAWEALERAGQAPDRLNTTSAGVFLALGNSDYSRMVWSNTSDIDVYYATGTAYSVAAGRLSYLLGLRGPSITLDTACSGSLVAVHLACQSLRSGESHLALAGGVNVILSPDANINFSKAQMLAPDDRCKTFDAAADGYVRSEGCGVVVLKRLSDAVADRDTIIAGIRGSGVNQDGRTSGLTAPNGPSQEAVIRAALRNAGVEPESVQYVEAHGTGTSLGDPIEIQALGAALGGQRSVNNRLRVGSVKTNIGHLEAAAGVAGLIKAALALYHEAIPAHLNLQQLSPFMDWASLPIDVPTSLIPWPRTDEPRIAGVSSFGFSGTNAHIILEEAPLISAEEPAEPTVPERPLHVLTLSARSPEALIETAATWANHLEQNPQLPVGDVAYTANVGRASFEHRLAVLAKTPSDIQASLASFALNPQPEGTGYLYRQAESTPEVAFLFSGQGSQYLNMGRSLYETQPFFREVLDDCAERLRPHLSRPLLEVMFEDAEAFATMTYAQPAIFSIQYALAALWRSWGIAPTTVLGHSIGEYAAACTAGLFSLDDGLMLAATRGRLMDHLPQMGEMMTVFADAETVAGMVAPYADRAAIAAVNAPGVVVISGEKAAIAEILAALSAARIRFRKLAVTQASHSPLVDPMLAELEQAAGRATYHNPRIGIVSGMMGAAVTLAEIGKPAYWRDHNRQAVQFQAAIQTLYADGYRVFVEIGPQPALTALGSRSVPEKSALWLPSLREGQDDWGQILETLAELSLAGVQVDWEAFDRPYNRRHLPLPTYPWQRQRYWIDHKPAQTVRETTWSDIVQAGERQSEQGPLDLDLASYPAKWEYLNHLAAAYQAQALRQLGVFTQPAEAYTFDELLAALPVLSTYEHLLGRWLGNLVEHQLLQQIDDRYIATLELLTIDSDELWSESEPVLRDLPLLIDYVRRCGGQLAPIITGKVSPLDTLFPNGSYETVDFLYSRWAVARYFNAIARAVVETANRGRKLRILEIGAGTGGLTGAVLPILPAETTYHFTDVSDFFLARAAQTFADYPFVQYGLLNIEHNLEDQGYAAHSYDLILAANVLHATTNLDQTLQHVRSLLAPGGLLLLYETTRHPYWFDITTGLIEGWQQFEDDWRGDNPLLSPEQWQSVLEVNGFEAVASLPENTILGQHIIIAQGPDAGQSTAAASQVLQTRQIGVVAEETSSRFMDELREALPADRTDLLAEFVRGHIRRVLRLDPDSPLERRQRLLDIGFDSLMAVELRSRLSNGLELVQPLPATLVFDYPHVEAISGYLLQLLSLEPQTAQQAPAQKPEAAATGVSEAEVADLSDEEIEALLLKKLGGL